MSAGRCSARPRPAPARAAVPRADARLGARIAPVRPRGRARLGARRRGGVRRGGRAPGGLPARHLRLGAVDARPGRLPHEPLRGARPALDGLVAPARDGVLPRAAGDAGLPRVRPRVRGAPTRPGAVRAHPGHAPRDGGDRPHGRGRAGAGAPHPDRDRARRGSRSWTPSGAVPPATRSACRTTRSSSGRSRRTASAWATGSSRRRSRARTCSSKRSTRAHRSLDELVVLLTGPARGYVRAELDAPRDSARPPAPARPGTG